jgi:hypothetical protein
MWLLVLNYQEVNGRPQEFSRGGIFFTYRKEQKNGGTSKNIYTKGQKARKGQVTHLSPPLA